ncbi:MAG TPA: zinc ribbon domain-containing protein [Ktedonobacteraceae bacterium]|nr:zinc ribbon domain-containing protein [Ktedonobacteraceae bacterium]
MSQLPGRPCPTCGTHVPAGQRFCSNCGTAMEVQQPGSQHGGPPPQNFPPASPVPPYAQAPAGQQQQYQQYQQYQQPQKSSPIAEALGALGLLFFLRRFRPGYRPRRQSNGCCGCLVLLVILLVVVGIPGYFYYKGHPNVINQIQNQTQSSNNSVSNGSASKTPTTSPRIITANINQQVTYAGVNITIESVQQSTAFADDNSATSGVIRVKVREVNNSGQDVVYFFHDFAQLILPDKSSVAPVNALQGGGIQNGITRENWIDFAVPTNDKIDQLTLILGTNQEAQIVIPLTGHANLSAFQTKTVNLNKPISYNHLNYTLQSATETLSIAGKQATTGMRYIILAFKVDNPSSNNLDAGSVSDYMRLMVGGITNSPMSTTLPVFVNANTTGTTGTVTFLMPANNSAYTLIFLATQGYSNVQVNTDFTIQ